MESLGTRKIDIDPSSDKPAAQEPVPVQEPSAPDMRRGLGTRHMQPPTQADERTEGRLPDGHQLQDRYQILGMLAVGGMSSVYQAQDLRFPKVKRVCVVKEMHNTAPDPQVRAMMESNFDREANILATLSHPGIVQVFDYIVATVGQYYWA